jgi:hypothetical protein
MCIGTCVHFLNFVPIGEREKTDSIQILVLCARNGLSFKFHSFLEHSPKFTFCLLLSMR